MQLIHSTGKGPRRGPFALPEEESYRRWRARKLARAAPVVELPVIELSPSGPTPSQLQALRDCCRHHNMARYAMAEPDPRAARASVLRLGRSLGLHSLDRSAATGSDGIAEIRSRPAQDKIQYVPFTNRSLSWHTDGYYNVPHAPVRAVIMHCVNPAVSGGENSFVDPELAYIALRDEGAGYVAALMHPACMTIPANVNGAGEVLRPVRAGPVFSVSPDASSLHMRFTARTRSAEWRADTTTRDARRLLLDFLVAAEGTCNTLRLEAGEGVLSNNVLHTRRLFTDAADPRLVLRARYHQRVAQPGQEVVQTCCV